MNSTDTQNLCRGHDMPQRENVKHFYGITERVSIRQHFSSPKLFINNNRHCKYHYPHFFKWGEYNYFHTAMSHSEKFQDCSVSVSVLLTKISNRPTCHSLKQLFQETIYFYWMMWVTKNWDRTSNMWYSCTYRTKGERITCANYEFFIRSLNFIQISLYKQQYLTSHLFSQLQLKYLEVWDIYHF